MHLILHLICYRRRPRPAGIAQPPTGPGPGPRLLLLLLLLLLLRAERGWRELDVRACDETVKYWSNSGQIVVK